MKIENRRVVIDPPKRPKKITGTRLASILGLNHWNTPFATWCAITRLYEEPFVDSVYTLAGKAIEPNIAKWLNRTVFLGDLVTADEHYGGDAFKKTWGDFFKKEKVFGGSWDAIVVEDGKITGVVEIKTTKRAEDWSKGVPEYYALQGALYAHLLGVNQVHMVCSFLEESDYEHPENFKPTSHNTIISSFLVSEKYPNFQGHLDAAMVFWKDHVLTGISPEYDEKKDAEILKQLKTNNVEGTEDLTLLLEKAEKLQKVLDSVSETEKELKGLKEKIKTQLVSHLRDTDTKAAVSTKENVWAISKGVSESVDKELLKKDGLLEKYSVVKETITLRVTKLKEEK